MQSFNSLFNNLNFIKQYLLHTRQTGSLIPSSNTLGFFMSEELLNCNDLSNKVVVELGGGNGVLSIKLAKILRHAKGSRLFIVEINPAFVKSLQNTLAGFANVEVLECDARSLKERLNKIGITRVDYIFSCLPFLSLPKQTREGIYCVILSLMDKNSVFVMFSYTKFLLKRLLRNFYLQKSMRVFANFPPAYIYNFVLKQNLFAKFVSF